MRKIILAAFCVLYVLQSAAQSPFLNTVKIEFEKVVYVRQLYKALEPEWYERIKDRLPETGIS